MKRPTGRPPSEGGNMNPLMVLADGSVRGIRDTGLPAINDEKLITFCLYGVKFQNKVGAGPTTRGVSERKTAGVSIMRLGDTIAYPIHHPDDWLKSMQSTPTEGSRIN